MLTLAPNLTQRPYQWTGWKAMQSLKQLITQYVEDADSYLVYGYDGPEIHLCSIWKGPVPEGVLASYSQEQNDADKADFEAHFKPTANWSLEKREKDGRQVMRISTATPGRLFRLRAIAFTTSAPASLHNDQPDETPYDDATVKEYDVNGALLTSDFSTAVKTVLDFESHNDYDLIGGWTEVDDSIHGTGLGQWSIAVLAAPDLPAAWGGCIDFVSEVDLAALQDRRLTTDGRASTTIKYDPVYHSGKLRFIIRHPAGVGVAGLRRVEVRAQ